MFSFSGRYPMHFVELYVTLITCASIDKKLLSLCLLLTCFLLRMQSYLPNYTFPSFVISSESNLSRPAAVSAHGAHIVVPLCGMSQLRVACGFTLHADLFCVTPPCY